MMHKLLERQLKKLGQLPEIAGFDAFIAAVDTAYCQAERDRELVERSLDLASQELLERNRQLREDIERRKQLEMELSQAEKLRAVGQLAAGIAHELNTPIQYVGDNVAFLRVSFETLSELVERAVAQTEDTQQRKKLQFICGNVPAAIEAAVDGCRRVADIVDAMKVFAHRDQAEAAFDDINRGLTCTLAVARNAIKYVADVHLDLGDLPEVECRIGDLNQVFLNLIINAAHAVSERYGEGGPMGNIWISSRAVGESVVVEVRDDGAGMPKAVQSRIFEPFFTTKEVGRGTGQGLAISRSIVTEKHAGSLTFTTAPGHGTTFRIELPVRPSPQSPMSRVRRAATEAPLSNSDVVHLIRSLNAPRRA